MKRFDAVPPKFLAPLFLGAVHRGSLIFKLLHTLMPRSEHRSAANQGMIVMTRKARDYRKRA